MGEEVKQKKKLSKQTKKYIFYIVLMLAVTALALVYIFRSDPQTVFNSIINAKSLYIFFMFLCVVGSWAIEGLVLTVFTKLYKKKYKLYQGALNGMIGSFFSAITPFASGGQFAQVFTFSKQGVRPSDSSSILVMLFIVSQTVIVFYGTLAMIFGFQTTVGNMQDINLFGWTFSPVVLSIIGFIMNINALFWLFVLSYSRRLHHFILNTLINLGAKLHIVKNPERKRTELAAQIATFRIELKRLMKNWQVLVITFVLEFGKFTLIHIMPYLAGLALNSSINGTVLDVIWADSYLSMITCFIPIPGGSGGAEVGFTLLFSKIFESEAIVSAANLLTRSISFYVTLIVGFIVFISYRGTPGKNMMEINNRKTFVDLQIVNLSTNTNIYPNLKPLDTSAEENNEAINEEEVAQDIKKAKSPKKRKLTSRFKELLNRKIEEGSPLSKEEVAASFENLKKTLVYDQQSIYTEDDEITSSSRQTLKEVYKEVDELEVEQKNNDKTDTEIELAIQEDLKILEEHRKKKAMKKDLAEQEKDKEGEK